MDMITVKKLRNLTALLLVLVGAVAVGLWAMGASPVPIASGQSADSLPPLRVVTDGEEVDPEACLTFVQKELEGPILIQTTAEDDLQETIETLFGGRKVLQEQEIIKVIQACNVDDEVEPINLERDLDVDIEIFSVNCRKAVTLDVHADCVVLRVAQDRNLR